MNENNEVIKVLLASQQEMRSDIRELTKNVAEIASLQRESLRHAESRISSIDSEIYGKSGGILARIRQLEIAQNGNRIRWSVLVGLLTVGVSTSLGFYNFVIRPAIEQKTENTNSMREEVIIKYIERELMNETK